MLTKEIWIVILFFAILGVLLLSVSALLGWAVKLAFRLSQNYGLYAGYTLSALLMCMALWGISVGFGRFEVKRVVIACDDLPAKFDGYRILQFTDAHMGSFRGREKLWKKAVDAMLAEDADLIVFTGDLQNHAPAEIEPFVKEMARLKARDGVFAVLGNHDYGYPPTKDSPRKVCQVAEKAGWNTLVNEHVAIYRGDARIILGGMDNGGDGVHFPRRGDVAKTLQNKACRSDSLPAAWDDVSANDFIIMLEHDPTSWRRNILRNTHAQLTLSGHTHAMQFGLLGWSPSRWIYDEWRGLFKEGRQHLYVSSGIGGVVPFRFGMPREVVVIELRRSIPPQSL